MKNIGLTNSIKGFLADPKSIKSIEVGSVGGLSIEIVTELSIDSYMYKSLADLNLDLYELKKKLNWKNINQPKE